LRNRVSGASCFEESDVSLSDMVLVYGVGVSRSRLGESDGNIKVETSTFIPAFFLADPQPRGTRMNGRIFQVFNETQQVKGYFSTTKFHALKGPRTRVAED
jgi:hypothetical protein